MSRECHDVVHRITPFIEIGYTTTSSGMKTNHSPFGLRFNMAHSAPMFFMTDKLIDTASSGQVLDCFIGFANMDDLEDYILNYASTVLDVVDVKEINLTTETGGQTKER